MALLTFRLWRGERGQGAFKDYQTEAGEGMVVLDAVHAIQAEQATDLSCRWNCKAGKCGSCSAEINGMPRLMCMTRMSTFTEDETISQWARLEAMTGAVGLVEPSPADETQAEHQAIL